MVSGRSLGKWLWKSLQGGPAVALSLILIGVGASFVLNVVLGRIVGAGATGLFYLGLAVMSAASILGRFGIDNVLLRHVAVHCAEGDWDTVAAIRRSGLRIVFLSSLGFGCGLFFVADFLGKHF